MFLTEKKAKQAFRRIKQDIFALGDEINCLRTELFDIKNLIHCLDKSISYLKLQKIRIPTQNPQNPTHSVTPTQYPTDKSVFYPLKHLNLQVSTGNQGVPTDRQTDRQTDKPTQINTPKLQKSLDYSDFTQKPIAQTINEASEALESLDAIKKAIRLKFKSITQQETLVFSTIYQLEEEGIQEIDYKLLAQRLGLSQSSIRDYIHRLISKGVPVSKMRVNNKKIILKISPELKKIASLQTILKLREI